MTVEHDDRLAEPAPEGGREGLWARLRARGAETQPTTAEQVQADDDTPPIERVDQRGDTPPTFAFDHVIAGDEPAIPEAVATILEPVPTIERRPDGWSVRRYPIASTAVAVRVAIVNPRRRRIVLQVVADAGAVVIGPTQAEALSGWTLSAGAVIELAATGEVWAALPAGAADPITLEVLEELELALELLTR